jgi:hypothetical protein
MKPKLVSKTKYFIALVPKNSDEDIRSIHVLIDKAWIGWAFECFDFDSDSFNSYLQRSGSYGGDVDIIVWFSSIQEAYQALTLKKESINKTMKGSKLNPNDFEWLIMNAQTETHTIATETENNLDEAIAGIALEDLKSKMTPAQLEILKNSI